jgi:hypothetical protein
LEFLTISKVASAEVQRLHLNFAETIPSAEDENSDR